MSFLNQFKDSIDTISTMYGVPHSDFTFIFAAPPFFNTLSDALSGNAGDLDKLLYPIGGAVQFNTQEGRQANQIKVIGTSDFIPLSGTGTAKTGVIQGLLLFSEMDEFLESSSTVLQGEGKWHLLKKLYAYLIFKYPGLVEYYYASGEKGSKIGLQPVAYDNSDKWRNFSASSLYDLPIGLYMVSKSSGGNTIQASFFEGVRIQGRQDFTISSVNNQPMYETVTFSVAKEIPVSPAAVLNTSGTETGSFDNFSALVKAYLKGE